jgi:putative FmdB family regulatory protein
MPIYGYICIKCNHSFDLLQEIASRDTPCKNPCPSCNEIGGVLQQLSAPPMLYSSDRKNTNGKWRDKLQQIHENTPGSRLDQVSTITKI